MSLPNSFANALAGLAVLAKHERNFRIHLVLASVCVGLGFWTGLKAVEWAIICVAIGMVLVAEGFNTALEVLADTVHPRRSSGIGRAKDVAAGAVLLSALSAIVVGAFIFLPYWSVP